MPTFETVNRLADQSLAAAYADLLTGFARNGMLEHQRLRRDRDLLRGMYCCLGSRSSMKL
jgi:hypothetical protein